VLDERLPTVTLMRSQDQIVELAGFDAVDPVVPLVDSVVRPSGALLR
jgi:hypothetical protein